MASKNGKFTPKRAFGTDSLANPRLANLAPAATNGLRGVAISAPNRGQAAREFDKRFKARGQAKRQTFDAQQFDAVVLCYLSAVAAGSTTGKAMAGKVREVSAPPGRKFTWLQLDQAIKALEVGQDIDYEGASGPINMNDAGDPTAGVYDVYEFKGGADAARRADRHSARVERHLELPVGRDARNGFEAERRAQGGGKGQDRVVGLLVQPAIALLDSLAVLHLAVVDAWSGQLALPLLLRAGEVVVDAQQVDRQRLGRLSPVRADGSSSTAGPRGAVAEVVDAEPDGDHRACGSTMHLTTRLRGRSRPSRRR